MGTGFALVGLGLLIDGTPPINFPLSQEKWRWEDLRYPVLHVILALCHCFFSCVLTENTGYDLLGVLGLICGFVVAGFCDSYMGCYCSLAVRLGLEWLYMMFMILPYRDWEEHIPDHFLLGYALRIFLWWCAHHYAHSTTRCKRIQKTRCGEILSD